MESESVKPNCMVAFSRNMAGFLLAAFIISQPSFVIRLKYCIEVFPMEDGTMCTMEMAENASHSGANLAFGSDTPCCATKNIEANKRYRAVLKDAKPTEKSSTVLFVVSAVDGELEAHRSLTARVVHSHSPPLNQLIIKSSVLLI